MNDLNKNSHALVVSLLIIIIGFAIYYLIINSKRIGKYFLQRWGEDFGQIYLIHFQRLLGIILFGIIPVSIFIYLFDKQLANIGLTGSFNTTTLYYTVSIGAILILINAIVTRQDECQKNYPQIRTKKWTIRLIIMSALGWAGYIFTYELLFRGILLSESIAVVGIPIAIVINILVYALVHIPKGLSETIGSVFFGIVLCLITIHTGTIWAAFLTHLILALSNEWFAIFHNKEIILKVR